MDMNVQKNFNITGPAPTKTLNNKTNPLFFNFRDIYIEFLNKDLTRYTLIYYFYHIILVTIYLRHFILAVKIFVLINKK